MKKCHKHMEDMETIAMEETVDMAITEDMDNKVEEDILMEVDSEDSNSNIQVNTKLVVMPEATMNKDNQDQEKMLLFSLEI